MSQRLPPVLVLFVFFVTGCGLSNVAPGKSDIGRVRVSGHITAVTYAPSRLIAEYPGFEQQRFNKGTYGTDTPTWKWMFEYGALVKAGETLIRDFGLEDPAVRVREELAGYFEKDLGFPPIIREKEPLKDDSVGALRIRFGAGTVLDFMTTSWKLYNFPSDPIRYRVSLTVRGRLIDLGDSKVLWRDSCSVTTGDNPAESPTFQELTAYGGAWLKELLIDASVQCADELKGRFKELK